MTTISKTDFCSMCGAKSPDTWETHPRKTVSLLQKSRMGSPKEEWTICDECFEGTQNTVMPKPGIIDLQSSLRRATIDDQREVLGWLLTKFKLEAVKKSDS